MIAILLIFLFLALAIILGGVAYIGDAGNRPGSSKRDLQSNRNRPAGQS